MSVSSRKQDENIVVTMLSIQGDKILGIEAPREMPVHRQKVHEEVRRMFLRLQNGTTLKVQKKRNAYSGKMREFVKSLAQHLFFQKVGFTNSRYTHDLVAYHGRGNGSNGGVDQGEDGKCSFSAGSPANALSSTTESQ
jgi:sRNA-binding carbon storage regulator CsrA